jgi:competence protein ComGC
MKKWNKAIQQRLSLFEIIFSVAVISVFLLVAKPFFSKMMENVERTALQQVIRNLNAAATLKMAEYVALDKLQLIQGEIRENPVSWLNLDDLGGWDRYQGEVRLVNFKQLKEKSWIYEQSTSRLIYKLANPELLDNEDPINNRIQFALKLDYVDINEDGQFTKEVDTINTLRVESIHPYRWQ